MNEQWEQINIDEISKTYGKADYAKIIDDEQGLRIGLVFENDVQVEFLFETSVLSYNVCDEGRRLKTLDFLTDKYGQDFFGEHYIYMVENSKYLSWFNEESHGIVSGYAVNHYVFLTSNDIVDVLTTYAPKIKIVN